MVSNFIQSEARARTNPFLAPDWLKFETVPPKRLYFMNLYLVPFTYQNFKMKILKL